MLVAHQAVGMRHWIYILSSKSRVTYTGMTRNLVRRIAQHRAGKSAFTRKYRVNRLVYAEALGSKHDAARREHQIKEWSAAKKRDLISAGNPTWDDLDPERFHPKRTT
jgi:putative endonuclease